MYALTPIFGLPAYHFLCGLRFKETFKVLRHLSHFPDVQYDCVSKSFRTGYLERELQVIKLSATRCDCITIL